MVYRERRFFFFILCEYQKSKVSNGFYLNFGVVFKVFSDNKPLFKSYDWHLVGRQNQILQLPHSLIEDVNVEDSLIDIESIINRVVSFLDEIIDIKYLKANFPLNFPHDKLWIQNIKSEDLKNHLMNLSPRC